MNQKKCFWPSVTNPPRTSTRRYTLKQRSPAANSATTREKHMTVNNPSNAVATRSGIPLVQTALAIPPNFFGISFGLAGLAGVWRYAASLYALPYTIGFPALGWMSFGIGAVCWLVLGSIITNRRTSGSP